MLGIGRPISTNLRKSLQGTPKRPPMDPMGTHGLPRGPRAAQREPSGRQNQAKGTPKPVQGQPKQAKRTNYISTNSRSTACAAVIKIDAKIMDELYVVEIYVRTMDGLYVATSIC